MDPAASAAKSFLRSWKTRAATLRQSCGCQHLMSLCGLTPMTVWRSLSGGQLQPLPVRWQGGVTYLANRQSQNRTARVRSCRLCSSSCSSGSSSSSRRTVVVATSPRPGPGHFHSGALSSHRTSSSPSCGDHTGEVTIVLNRQLCLVDDAQSSDRKLLEWPCWGSETIDNRRVSIQPHQRGISRLLLPLCQSRPRRTTPLDRRALTRTWAS
mmetsp:Transcript_86341/g.244920  ORF Transcript_86341/g.244920 Transcript_86341/m.244920 type:complete len:211 (+) Transcript_86341:107-739(+)